MPFVLDSSVALAWEIPDEGNAYADERRNGGNRVRVTLILEVAAALAISA